MKSNPAVFPSKPYPKLKVTNEVNKEFNKKTIDFSLVQKEFNLLTNKLINVNGKNTEERILSIFLSPEVLFGPKKNITDFKEDFLKKILFFTKSKKPIQLTVLGFPFKMEVPLKTNRTLPDMGEVLSLSRLYTITKSISKIYKPGAIVTIFAENSFAEFVQHNQKTANAYVSGLKILIKKLGIDNSIKVEDIGRMKILKDFNQVYSNNLKDVNNQIKDRSGKFYERYLLSKDVIFRLISVKGYDKEVLYNLYASNNQDAEIAELKKEIENHVEKGAVKYLAYLKSKDDLNYLNRKVGENLSMTVSPKPGKLGILPVGKNIDILPYHGVPLKRKNKNWEIKYLCELEFNNKIYTKVYLKGDKDKEPFFYEE